MLMRTDPFREFDRLTQQLLGGSSPGTWSRPNPMPMDAYRAGDDYVVAFDLPGVPQDAIEARCGAECSDGEGRAPAGGASRGCRDAGGRAAARGVLAAALPR